MFQRLDEGSRRNASPKLRPRFRQDLDTAALSSSLLLDLELTARQKLDKIASDFRLAPPAGIGLDRDLRHDWESYQQQFDELRRGLFDPARQVVGQLVDSSALNSAIEIDQTARMERLVEAAAYSAREVVQDETDAKAALARIDAVVQEIFTTSRSGLERAIDLAKSEAINSEYGVSAWESKLADVVQRESRILGSVTAEFDALSFLRTGDGLHPTNLDVDEALEEELLALRERLDRDLEVVSLGMAVEIVAHEFDPWWCSIRLNLRRLKTWADANPPLKEVYEDIRTTFEHLDGYLRLLTPMQRRLYRQRTEIRGAEIFRFINDLFAERAERERVGLSVTPAFQALSSMDSAQVSTRFCKPGRNAMYWVGERAGRQEQAERIVVLDAEGPAMLVRDNGPGVNPRQSERISSLVSVAGRMGVGRGCISQGQCCAKAGS